LTFDTTNLSALVSQISKLGSKTALNATSNLPALATNLRNFVWQINNIGGVSFNVASLTQLITALSALGTQKAINATNNLPALATNLTYFIRSMNQMGALTFNASSLSGLVSSISSLGTQTALRATANLPQLAANLSSFVYTMNRMGSMTFNSANLISIITAIGKLGTANMQRVIANLPQLAAGLSNLITTLSRTPAVSAGTTNLVNAVANLSTAMGQGSSSANSFATSLSRYSNSASKATKRSKGLASAIGKIYATYWLLFRAFQKISDAMDYASQLTEVQNVVDNTFGIYSDALEEMASTSIETMGISALSTKKTASTFQAMGKAIGFAQDDMADMSLQLTQLSADMASFYDVDQSDVAEDLQSIFTGTTKPLRQYGLDLTEATLKEWALKNGMDADISSMSQLEKVQLRYQYVLANTSTAQGDFARTSNTWANQVRILKQNFIELANVIGRTFIAALKPLVRGLNTAIGYIIQFAEVVSDALGQIFGWEYDSPSGGLASDYEDAESAADGLADSTGTAADNAKKLKQQLQGFDELNVLTTNDTTSSGSGSSGTTSTDTASGGTWTTRETMFDYFTSSIDSLYELGSTISQKITDSLNGINWNSVYNSARNFGTGLANFLNGLITPDLFGALGQTVGGAINTALHALDSFGETFNWKNFGNSIATGINKFFKTTDFALAGETATEWISGILDTLIEAVDDIDWDTVGDKLGDFFDNLDVGKIAGKLGKLAVKLLEGLGEAILNLTADNPLAGAIVGILAVTKVTGFASKIGGLASSILGLLGVGFQTSGAGTAAANGLVSGLSASIGTAGVLGTLKQIGIAIVAGLALEEAIAPYVNEGIASIQEELGDTEGAEYQRKYNTLSKSIPELASDVQEVGLKETAREIAEGWRLTHFGDDSSVVNATQEAIDNMMPRTSGSRSTGSHRTMTGQANDREKASFQTKIDELTLRATKAAEKAQKKVTKTSQTTYDKVQKIFSKGIDLVLGADGDKAIETSEDTEASIKKTIKGFKTQFKLGANNTSAIKTGNDTNSTLAKCANGFKEKFKLGADGTSATNTTNSTKNNILSTVTGFANKFILGADGTNANNTTSSTKKNILSIVQGFTNKFILGADGTSANSTTNSTKSTISKVVQSFSSMFGLKADGTSATNTTNSVTNSISSIVKKFAEVFGLKADGSSAEKTTDNTKKSVLNKLKDFKPIVNVTASTKSATDSVDNMISYIKKALATSLAAKFGISVSGSGANKTFELKKYATGGFPSKADIFYANENGVPELVGTVGGRTAVASGTEITGISDAVYNSSDREASLLTTAIGLLQVIANKDTGITQSDVYNAVRRENKQRYNQTGINGLVY
jgi:hypothetical protein